MNWVHTSKGGEADPCNPRRKWFGIECTNGRVVKISLTNNNLKGTIPKELAKLSALQHLDIDRARSLSGTLPAQFAELADIQHLEFDATRISGTLPDVLTKNHTLARLRVGRTRISGTLPP